MDYEDIKFVVENNYDIDIKHIEKVKNTYKISVNNKEFCLKLINYEYAHFYFILSAIEHLQNREFKYIPNIIINRNNNRYIKIKEQFAYLTPWLKCRQCNYDNPIDLKKATKKLAELHKCSEGFTINKNMKPRIGWFSWEKVFETRGKEILDFKHRIYQKAYKSDFDKYYLILMEDELLRVESTLNNLKKSDYFNKMKKEVFKRGFCHHDYAHHNILIDENEQLNIIDFDYCILDTHLHDLGSLCIRSMKEGKWDITKFKYIIENYSTIINVSANDIQIIAAFMEFPQAYWQIGIQYYWEQQPWSEDVFMKKLIRYSMDKEIREEFIKEIREINWR